MQRLLVAYFLLLQTPIFSQLDTIHWLPPMHARADDGPQFLYLSTPETAEFPVEIRTGDGQVLAVLPISNSQPQRLQLGNGTADGPVLVSISELHRPLVGKGLVIAGEKKFYAYLRAHADNRFHACDLTCKGRAALGKTFRVGHVLQQTHSQDRRSNFVGIMASEDSTEVSLSEFDPLVRFRMPTGEGTVIAPVRFMLNAGETLVFSNYISADGFVQPPNGLLGALVEATRPVAVNCGSWLGAPVINQAHDIGVDQIAPLEQVGKEYILCKGNGGANLEHPILIAHHPNTKVWMNGGSAPIVTLAAGEAFVAGTNDYSADGNIYFQTSQPVFMYQMIGGVPSGNDEPRTAGLIFVPPVSCATPNAVDNIFEPNSVNDMYFEGGVMVVAMRDSAVVAKIDGKIVSLGSPKSVPGNVDFVTYRKLDLWDQNDTPKTLSIIAEGPVQVAMFGRNEPASFAAFFSGFSKIARPTIEVALAGDGVCPDTLLATGKFDGVQWMLEDSVLQFGKDTFFVAYSPGLYRAVGYLGVCRRTDFAEDSVAAKFNSPAFPFSFEEPSCFGFSDGKINFGQPTGGIAPYQFSIDKGQNFSKNEDFDFISAGKYQLVARDSTGCYNRPLEIEVGQPDSFKVKIVAVSLPDPLKPGMPVRLEGQPDRPIFQAKWSPTDSSGCGAADCLEYLFHPLLDTEITLTVADSAGCPASDRFQVFVEPNIFAPNVFQAGNSLARNDRFQLLSRDPISVLRLRIFDRWGALVFENKGFKTNDLSAGWDGSAKGKNCLPGVYIWLAEVELSSGKEVSLRGDLTLIR